MLKLDPQLVWRGTHHAFPFKICHWGKDTLINEGHGVWNYYVYLLESRIPDFDALWLPTTRCKILPSSVGFPTHDYYSIPPANVHWHGGVTYYAKHGNLSPFRTVELGCDYSHLWDHERNFNYSLQDITLDVEQTCNELNSLYPEPSRNVPK